jgi:hypothetical protein
LLNFQEVEGVEGQIRRQIEVCEGMQKDQTKLGH